MKIKKILFNILKYIIFLGFGVFLFLQVTKEYKFKDLIDALKNYNFVYILIAIFFNILSNISRSIRWNLLLDPLGHKVKIFNAFLSVQVMYLANFFVPRAGEVARCGVLAKTDNVPFPKLVGTVVIERTIDALTLLLLSFIVFLTQINILRQYLSENLNLSDKGFVDVLSNIYVLASIVVIILGIVILFVLRNKIKSTRVYLKIRDFIRNIVEGIKSVKKVKKPFALVLHTIFIYVMWFFMMITFFKGFQPTSEIGAMPVLTVFVLSSLSMILPVPAGMGAFHYAVASALVLYGVQFEVGGVIAFIMHTAINMYLWVFGFVSLVYFVFMYFLKSKNNPGAL